MFVQFKVFKFFVGSAGIGAYALSARTPNQENISLGKNRIPGLVHQHTV